MKKNDNAASPKPSVQVLERMFTLIDVLASREEAVSLKEISERTGLHPSTTHRILNDLAIGRFVDRPESGSYRLGMRFLELCQFSSSNFQLANNCLCPHIRNFILLLGHLSRYIITVYHTTLRYRSTMASKLLFICRFHNPAKQMLNVSLNDRMDSFHLMG